MSKLRSYVIAPLLAISFTFVNPCSKKAAQYSPTPKQDDEVFEVSVIYPQFKNLPRLYKSEGVFDVSEKVVIKAKASGKVEELFVSEGDVVEKGDPLFVIDSNDLQDEIDLKRLKIKELTSRLKILKGKLDGVSSADMPVSNEDVEFLDDDFIDQDTPQKNYGTAQKKELPETVQDLAKLVEDMIKRFDKEVLILEKRLLDLSHKSPADGVVTAVFEAEKNNVSYKDQVIEVSQINPLSVKFFLPSDVASFIDKQTEVALTLKDNPDVKSKGTVYFIAPNVDPTKKTIEVRAHMTNEDGKIKGGQKADIEVLTRKIDRVLILPKQALVYENGKTFLFVIKGSQAKLLEVEKGRELDNKMVEVIADISVDDPVVVERPMDLKNKSFVKIIKKSDQNTVKTVN